MVKRLILWSALLIVALSGPLPLLYMLLKGMVYQGHLDFSPYGELLQSSAQWKLLIRSLLIGGLVASFSTALGVPIGVLLGKSDIPFRGLFTLLFLFPLLMPPYFMAVAWFDLLGHGGVLYDLLPSALAQWLNRSLFGIGGVCLVLSSIYLPIPMLLTMAFVRGINPSLEEAARMICSWWCTLRGVTIPLIMPGIFLGWLLVFIMASGEYSVPAFFRVNVYSVESFTLFSAQYDFRAGAVSSLPIALACLLLLLLGWYITRGGDLSMVPFGARKARACVMELRQARLPMLVLLTALVFALVILPLSGLAIKAGPFANYVKAISMTWHTLVRSIGYASMGATILCTVGYLLGYNVARQITPLASFFDGLCVFLFAMPGTVLGIGLICLWNHPLTNIVYGTSAIIILGYVAKYMALTSRISLAQLLQIPRSMEEAAQMVGASWPRRLLGIMIPLSKRGLVAAWLVGFLFCLRDTDITMLVYPPGLETMPVRIFTYMANGAPELIAAMCMIMFLSIILLLPLLWVVFTREW